MIKQKSVHVILYPKSPMAPTSLRVKVKALSIIYKALSTQGPCSLPDPSPIILPLAAMF